MEVPKALAEAAVHIASEIKANAILVLTETGKNCEPFSKLRLADRHGKEPKLIVATPDASAYREISKNESVRCVKMTVRPRERASQVCHAISCGVHDGFIYPGDRVVCLTGDGFADFTDSLIVMDVTNENLIANFLESNPVLSATVELSLDLGKSGVDGKPVGASFVIGDTKSVLRFSRQLAINPFRGYHMNIKERRQWDLIRKYAFFDGSFVVDNNGIIIAAQRYLDANVKVEIPAGLGTRHLSVAAMTAATKAIGITVSGEHGIVRIFEKGREKARIDPKSKIIESFYKTA